MQNKLPKFHGDCKLKYIFGELEWKQKTNSIERLNTVVPKKDFYEKFRYICVSAWNVFKFTPLNYAPDTNKYLDFKLLWFPFIYIFPIPCKSLSNKYCTDEQCNQFKTNCKSL